MERITTVEKAGEIFGRNFIGPKQLAPFFKALKQDFSITAVPPVQYSELELERYSKDYILILGIPASHNGWPIDIKNLRLVFGTDPDSHEPCFYNQDWYMNQDFLTETLALKWYLIKKSVIEKSRAIMPDVLLNTNAVLNFPSAVLCTYVFFAWYYHTNGEILWKYDFIWCMDKDHNGDRIYVGKYKDIDGLNKNGFSIHRHLALRSCYASIEVV